MYQDPGSSLDPHWKVKRILSEPLVIHTDLSKRDIEKQVFEIIEAVGLGGGNWHCTLMNSAADSSGVWDWPAFCA